MALHQRIRVSSFDCMCRMIASRTGIGILPHRIVRHPVDCERLLPGEILVAPPDRHLTVEIHEGIARARLWHSAKENFTRPAIDPLFRSAAAAFDGRVIGTILTGYLDDGTAGLHAVKTQGGWSVVQDPHDAAVPDMPSSAIRYVEVDHVLSLEHIGPKLAALARHIADTSPGLVPHAPPELPESLAVENRFITGTAGIEDLQRIGKSSCYIVVQALWSTVHAL